MATYGSEVGVEGLNAHFTGGYTTTSVPSSSQVAIWLAEGYARINAALAMGGYATPVASTAAIYPALVGLNDLFAAARAEQATNIGPTADTETRADKLWQQYNDGLTALLAGDLQLVGLTLVVVTPARRSIRSVQLRHYDGYARRAEGGEYTA